MATVDLLVEGHLDAAVAARILAHCGHERGFVFGLRGAAYIEQKAHGFLRSNPNLLVLVDSMDLGQDCLPSLRAQLTRDAQRYPLLRLVGREIESWLMADRAGFARFLGVPLKAIPERPEETENPKLALVTAARGSPKRGVREDIVPGSHASEGPGYTGRLSGFVAASWDVEAAARRSDSLGRCLRRVREIA